jgi:hypothetical protein
MGGVGNFSQAKPSTVLDFTGMADCFSRTLTTGSNDVLSGTFGNDTFTGATATYQTGDIIVDSLATDSDVLNITLAGTATVVPTVIGVEATNFNVTSFTDPTINIDNIKGGTITVNQLQSAGSTNAGVTSAALYSALTLKAGTGVTGTFTVGNTNADATTSAVVIDGGSATTVTQTATAAPTGSLNITANSALAITATGAAITVTDSKVGIVTTAPIVITLEGTAAITDTATVSAAGIVTFDTHTNQDIETLNLSGNGAAVTYNLSADTVLTTLNATGSQSVTVVGTAAQFTGKTFTDTSTGSAVSTIKVITTAGTIDATNLSADVIRLGVNMAGNQVDIKNGATVAVSVSDAVGLDLNGPTATATTNSVTIQVDDFTAGLATGPIALSTVDVTQIKNVALLINDNTTAAGSFGSTTAVTATGAGTLGFTSTAASLNATGLTGVLTATASANLTSIIGGSANDIITGYAGAMTINGGAGTDTLALAATTDLTTAPIALSNIEIIQMDSATPGSDTVTIKSSNISGASYIIKGTGAAIDTLKILLDATTVNAGSLIVDTSTAKVDFDLTGVASLATTVIGTNGVDSVTGEGTGAISMNAGDGNDTLDVSAGAAAHVINGEAGDDTITGGAENQTFTGGEGADSITGGAGNDTINLIETTAAIDTVVFSAYAFSANGVDVINGFAAGTGVDLVQLVAASTTNAQYAVGADPDFAASSNTTLTSGAAAFALTGGNTTTDDIIEITATLSANGTLSATAVDGTELLKALSSTTTAATGLTVDTNGDTFYAVAYQNGNAYLYEIIEGAGASLAVAADIHLIGVFNTITANAFATGDFTIA